MHSDENYGLEVERLVRAAVQDAAVEVLASGSRPVEASVGLRRGNRWATVNYYDVRQFASTCARDGAGAANHWASYSFSGFRPFGEQRLTVLAPVLTAVRAWMVECVSPLRLIERAEGMSFDEPYVRAFEAGSAAFAQFSWDRLCEELSDPRVPRPLWEDRLLPVAQIGRCHPVLRAWRPHLGHFRLEIVSPFETTSDLPVIMSHHDGPDPYRLATYKTGETLATGPAGEMVSALAEWVGRRPVEAPGAGPGAG